MRPPPKAAQRLVASRGGRWFFVHVSMRIDRVLMPLTKGRLSMSLSMPDGLLVCRGAKSGAERRVPLVYVPLGDERVVLVASNGGAPHQSRVVPQPARPSGRAHSRCKGAELRVPGAPGWRATSGADLWDRAVRQYLGYATYQDRTDAGDPRLRARPVQEPRGLSPRRLALDRQQRVGRVDDRGEALVGVVGDAHGELRLARLVERARDLGAEPLGAHGVELDRRDGEAALAEADRTCARPGRA